MNKLIELIQSITKRDPNRSEAELQAEIRQLLIEAPLDLGDNQVKLESALKDARRIDIEVGATVIEVKRNLRKGRILEDAIHQLTGYVIERTHETDQAYVGLLTDGAEWRCFHLQSDQTLIEVAHYVIKESSINIDDFINWLDGILATQQSLLPNPNTIETKLGAGSPFYKIHHATLFDLYRQHRDLPTVQMKRSLWAKLLTTALGSHFEDNDDLFVEHTLLVNTAEIIAHAVLGLPIRQLEASVLLSGSAFTESGLHGVVENDFFDWVLDIPNGDRFVQSLAAKISRFDWTKVSYDVMKILYESIIDQTVRQKLGEYYTPDWLAEVLVREVVDQPLVQKVLDPSCGSGTFLFHTIRRCLQAARDQDLDMGESIHRITQQVIGFDIHPVAVTLARVTYLLALGRENLLSPDRAAIHIPVYLADSMQWRQKPQDLLSHNHIVINTSDEGLSFESELRFPFEILKQSQVFDELIQNFVDRLSQKQPQDPIPEIVDILERLNIDDQFHPTLETTFQTMCSLHDQGRDHIWGYYIRNLVRPTWLSLPENHVHILLGNPPWLSYRKMPEEMQSSFRKLSQERSLWHGAKNATHQDLSALFVVKAIQSYLQDGGKFAFVMPNSVLDRDYFQGFRNGCYATHQDMTQVAFQESWDLKKLRPHFFPRGSAVIFGHRSDHAERMPHQTEQWSGRVNDSKASWSSAQNTIKRQKQTDSDSNSKSKSGYAGQFFQGATIVPRVLMIVEPAPRPVLGLVKGTSIIQSKRSALEKEPWCSLPSRSGVIESQFIWHLYTGSSILPFRCTTPELATIPWDEQRQKLIHGDVYELGLYQQFSKWWRESEKLWMQHRTSDRLTLIQQVNYMNKLSHQFPVAAERVVYATSGMHICAARLLDQKGIIDSKLYWMKSSSRRESDYLCAVLNAAITTDRTRPFMSYGKDERDIHKHVWKLPIPKFNSQVQLHQDISGLGQILEKKISDLPLRSVYFSSVRADIRKFIANSKQGQKLEALVTRLLDDC